MTKHKSCQRILAFDDAFWRLKENGNYAPYQLISFGDVLNSEQGWRAEKGWRVRWMPKWQTPGWLESVPQRFWESWTIRMSEEWLRKPVWREIKKLLKKVADWLIEALESRRFIDKTKTGKKSPVGLSDNNESLDACKTFVILPSFFTFFVLLWEKHFCRWMLRLLTSWRREWESRTPSSPGD